MRRLGAMLIFTLSLAGAWPVAALADCADDCGSGCEGKPAKEWSQCMEPCLKKCAKEDPPKVPAPSPPAPVPPAKK